MSNVNHDHTVAGNSSELVPEQEAHKQQLDAAMAPDVPLALAKPPVEVEREAPVAKAERSIYHKMEISVLVSLDLTRPFMLGRKKSLSTVRVDGVAEPLNLYSPFRAAAKAKGDKPAVLPGIVRSVLESMLDVTDEVNGNRIMVLGKESEVVAALSKAVKGTRSQFEKLLPVEADTIVATALNEDTGEQLDITFDKIVRVGSWLNSSMADGLVGEHNAVMSLTVNSGIVYDSEERFKAIMQVESVLERTLAKRDGGETQLLMAVLLDPANLIDPDMRELLDALITVGKYELYTRNELNRLNIANWLPLSKAEVGRELLVETSEIMLLKLIGDDEEDAAADDAAEADPAE